MPSAVARYCALALFAAAAQFATAEEWSLKKTLPELGHRNWIIVADAAYPAQVGEGVEVVYVGGDLLTLAKEVLDVVDAAPHVRAKIYVDAELQALDDELAPGVTEFRQGLRRLVGSRPGGVKPLLHSELLETLGEAGKSYRVVVLKTDKTVPYTSLFINLDCGYWSDEQEAKLREKMAAE
jgi:L-fucose mutarotase/ribose pyranase (RbsD/FucU family)